MSFTAYVAFETDTGFDIHYSHNGGDEYVLYPVLQQWLADGDAKRGVFNVPAGITAAAVDMVSSFSALQQEVKVNNPPLVHPDPVATDVSPTDVFTEIDTYDTETVYLVTDDAVETIVPVNPSAEAFNILSEHASVDFYRFETRNQLQFLMQNRDSITPISISGDEFAPETLAEQPDWVKNTITYAHRYLLNNVKRLKEMNANTAGQVKQDENSSVVALDGVVMDMSLTTDPETTNITVPDTGIPITVSWNNGVPSYPMYFENERYGAMPKNAVSELRSPIAQHTTIDRDAPADMMVETATDQDVLLDVLFTALGDEIPREYTPEQFQHVIDAEL